MTKEQLERVIKDLKEKIKIQSNDFLKLIKENELLEVSEKSKIHIINDLESFNKTLRDKSHDANVSIDTYLNIKYPTRIIDDPVFGYPNEDRIKEKSMEGKSEDCLFLEYLQKILF